MTREQVFEIVDAAPDLMPTRRAHRHRRLSAVDWQDGHRSRFDPGWLRAHAYDDESRAERLRRKPKAIALAQRFAAAGVRVPALMNDNDALLQWLLAVRDIGLTQVRGVPTEPGSLKLIAQRISFIRESNFGVLFNVQSKADADSNAYTAFNLPLHSGPADSRAATGAAVSALPGQRCRRWREYFCRRFCDCRCLASGRPRSCSKALCEIPVEFRNKDRHSDYRCLAPIIALDALGQVSEIRMANFLRGPFDTSVEQMPRLYRAYRRFIAMTREPRFRLMQRLNPGELWCFDNRRTLHARNAFDPASGARHFQGCYIDRDELLSRILVLQR